jgi:Holliday junction resolvase RusA-like endonuclease
VIRATLPLPPSVNSLYATRTVNGKPRRVKTEAGKRFKADVGNHLLAAGYTVKDARWLVPPLALEATFYFATKRRNDADNRIKALQDSVASFFGFDDSLVKLLVLRKEYDKHNPRCEVVLGTLTEGEG